MRKIVTVALSAALVAAGCADSTSPEGLGDPPVVEKVSGDRQAGVGGEPLVQPFVVTVRSRIGRVPRPGAEVRWSITSSVGGSLSDARTTTDSLGRTAVTATLPNFEGATLTAEASLPDNSSSATFTAVVARTRSGAATLRKVSGDGQAGSAGEPLGEPYVVKVVDEAGAAVSGAEVRFRVEAGGGSLSDSRVTSDADGDAAVTATLPDSQAVTQTVTATMASLVDTVTFTSASVGPATSVAAVSGDGQAGTGGEPLGEPFVVEVTDAVGNPLPGESVEWAITSSSGGSLSAERTTTDDRGRTAVTATLPNLEDATLTAEASLADTAATATFSAEVARTRSGAVALQKVSGDDQVGPPGEPLEEPYVVKVVDEAGAGVSGAEAQFWVEGGGGSLSASSVTSDADGEAAVTATLPDSQSVTQTVGATVASLVDTVAFTSTAVGPPTSIAAVSGDGQAGTGGEPLGEPFVVEVTDAAGNRLPGESVEWAITSSSGGSLSAERTTTDDRGRTAVTATLPNLEDATLTAEASLVDTDASVTFSAEVARTRSGAVALQKVSGDNQVGPPGEPLDEPYVVKVVDEAGAGVSGAEAQFWVEGGGGSLSASSVTSDADGEAAVTATLPDADGVTQTVGATVASLADSLTFSSTAVEPTGGPAEIQIVSGNEQEGMVRRVLLDSLRVEVTNSEGAAVEDARVMWRIVSENGGSLADSATATNEEGEATNRWRLGDEPGATDEVIARIDPPNNPRQSVTFTAEVTGTPDTIVVDQGAIELDNNATDAPEKFIPEGDTVTVAPGHWARDPFEARVLDADDRTVRGATLTWTVTSGGGTVGDEPDGPGLETVMVTTDSAGSITVWRRAPGDAPSGDWIGATLSLENFPGVTPMTLDALVRP